MMNNFFIENRLIYIDSPENAEQSGGKTTDHASEKASDQGEGTDYVDRKELLDVIRRLATDGFQVSLGKIELSVGNRGVNETGTFIKEVGNRPETLSRGLINIYGIDPTKQVAFFNEVESTFEVNPFMKPYVLLSFDAVEKYLQLQTAVSANVEGVPIVGTRMNMALGDEVALKAEGSVVLSGADKYGDDDNQYSGMAGLTFFPTSVGIDSLGISSRFVKDANSLNINGEVYMRTEDVGVGLSGYLESVKNWDEGGRVEESKGISASISSHGFTGLVDCGTMWEEDKETLKEALIQTFKAIVVLDVGKLIK